ncbi:c-type cytochrome [Arcobacter arenosus]|uniref:C-type cytochrome n=1 Tax=Arcobacter arenosus TaxID=2576037 RepID=A0A5R8Y1W2_9BACT|nr:c-type cytochrome [Arcobacter arenosus]TLP39317.1 c-type cytochrome [Arcobacter arenosus]
MKVVALFFCFISYLFALPDEFDRKLYNEGEKIFEAKCSSCHQKSIQMQTLLKNFLEEDNRTLKLLAPTGNQISFRLKSQIGSPDDREFHLMETADFLVEYVNNPNKSKSICLEGVVKHFDTMPSLKGKITEEEIRTVNHFLYFLEGFNGVNKYYHKEDAF